MEPSFFATDRALFAALPGGSAVIDWFGFCPVFHDGCLERLELSGGDATLAIRAFRTTDEVDAKGFFILHRHALVTLRLRGVTGVRLEGDAVSIISELLIRRLDTDAQREAWQTCERPKAGDIEVAFGTAIGLHGAIFAKELAFAFQPVGDDTVPGC